MSGHGGSPVKCPRSDPSGLREDPDGIEATCLRWKPLSESVRRKTRKDREQTDFKERSTGKSVCSRSFLEGLISCLVKSARYQSREENHGSPADLRRNIE